MNHAHLRFYAELNDLIPACHRQRPITPRFDAGQTVKHLIEALGVPHTEVHLILVNGRPAGLAYQVQDGDRVSVYPPFRSIDVTPLPTVQPPPLPEARFVLDGHLGRLAAYLRLAGFDTLYRNDSSDEELARISSREARILLTRDRGLLKRSIVRHGYWLRATDPRAQFVEVLRRYDLFDRLAPFSRCLACNGRLRPVPKEAIADRLPPRTRAHYDEFQICRSCRQIYWRGSHVDRMQALIRWALEQRCEP